MVVAVFSLPRRSLPLQKTNSPEGNSRPSRRGFLKNSAATLAGATLAASADLVANVHAGGSDLLKVGLIGCGGRGTGAATQALNADPNVRLIAMGDAFADHLEESLRTLKKEETIAGKVDVKPDHCFVGFDAYRQVLATPIDVVILATPPHFRPAHLKAAVDAGKHVFCEKPVAVDAPGVRSVLATCEEARAKRLSLVSGLCFRYEHAKRETMTRVHDGAIGDIVALQTSYNMGYLWVRDRQPGWSDMEWQLRNWLYFTWLSGDHIVEQHIHSLDKMAWAMKDEYPIKATGMGGRQVRVEPKWGNIFDHHSVVFEYASGPKLFSCCRQQNGTAHDISDHIFGTKGTCHVMTHQITGEHPWSMHQDPRDDMYQNEHDELFASIRSGKPINNGDYMTRSTLMAIMGRMATYTGQVVTWEKALNSKQDLTPPHYEFGSLPVAPVARPGITKFV
jgi:myo-inositol 2-dehydrogenase / D-chiro-inositol 1-dehydrogenase